MTQVFCHADESTSSTSWGSQVRVLYRPLDASTTVTEGESNQDYHSSDGDY